MESIWDKKSAHREEQPNCFSKYHKRHFNKSVPPKKINKDNSPKRKPKKFKWHDGRGRELTAGGLLPYDDKGIWVIGEKKSKNSSIEYTDAGGKYRFEDGDIYFTISREVSEELYHSLSLTREAMLKIRDNHSPTYVNGPCNIPVYICYVVHVKDLRKYGVVLNPVLFDKNRKKVLKGNPDVPTEFYSSVELRYLRFKEFEDNDIKPKINLSHRLKRILKYGPLTNHISCIGTLSDRSITPDTSDGPQSELDDEEIHPPLRRMDIMSPMPINSSSHVNVSFMNDMCAPEIED